MSTMKTSVRQALAAMLGGVLAVCGSSRGADTPTQAAIGSSGPGASDRRMCAVPYGDPPRPPAGPPSITGTLGEVANLFNECLFAGGETLNWSDRENEPRSACLFIPPGATRLSQRPLLVFLQGSVIPAPPQLIISDWAALSSSADLSGDPQRPGFILLVPIGRNTQHFYPFPDDQGLGWDNWYRNLDRATPDLNLDVAAIDAFIAQVESRSIVDTERVYLTGWSNGAAMAQLYALNTPAVAAAAVYSSPDPFSDVQDPCYQSPFATTPTPLMDIHNACDIGGICQTGTRFHQDLARLYPALPQDPVIVNALKMQVQACQAGCASQGFAALDAGVLNQVIWPRNWNNAMFTWLREHPLPAKRQ
jgi:hypothetical protein